MQPVEQAVQPRDHSSIRVVSPNTRQNRCACGNPKRSIADTCLECFYKLSRSPDLGKEIFVVEEEQCCKIPLTCGYYALICSADYDWLSRFLWHLHWQGEERRLYAVATGINGGPPIRMHRLILGLTDRKVHGDHKNGDGLDNRRSNLRPASSSQNGANRIKINCNNTTGFRGVYFRKKRNRYVSAIRANGKSITIGYFVTALEAALARDIKARELHGEFAVLNFPNGPPTAS